MHSRLCFNLEAQALEIEVEHKSIIGPVSVFVRFISCLSAVSQIVCVSPCVFAFFHTGICQYIVHLFACLLPVRLVLSLFFSQW